jgi:hypothetical protein
VPAGGEGADALAVAGDRRRAADDGERALPRLALAIGMDRERAEIVASTKRVVNSARSM